MLLHRFKYLGLFLLILTGLIISCRGATSMVNTPEPTTETAVLPTPTLIPPAPTATAVPATATAVSQPQPTATAIVAEQPAAPNFYYGVLQPHATAADVRSLESVAKTFQELKTYHINIVYEIFPVDLTPADWKAYLDIAQQEGIAVIAVPGWTSDNPNPADLSPILDYLAVIGDHPALYGYTYLHEPWEMFSTDQIQTMYKEIKADYPDVRLGVVWSGELTKYNQGNRRFTVGLCDICLVNMKAFQEDAEQGQQQGIIRTDGSAAVLQSIDPDAEIWASVQVWSPLNGGRRGFRVPSPQEMTDLFCTVHEQYPIQGFLWGVWAIDKSNEGTLSSPELAAQRQAVADIYTNCVQN